MSRRWRPALLVGLAVIGLAAGLRIAGLDRVGHPYWDERFYAADASAYLGRTPAQQRPTHPVPDIAENSWMQPPLGKWLIAGGDLVAGDGPWGYRLPSALAGSAGVGLVYLLGLELTGSAAVAGLAGTLLALDGLHLALSRVAMLDVFASTFGLAGLYLLLLARRARAPDSRRRLVVASGVALGAAVACKWSAVPYLVLAAAAASTGSGRLWPGQSARRRAAGVALAYGAVPLAVYLASYVSFFVQHGLALGGFAHLQWAMFQYGRHFDPGSPAASPAWGWPLMRGSIDLGQAVFYPGIRAVAGQVVVLRVLTAGNPVLWWAFLAALPYLVWSALARRRRAEGFVLAGYLAGWVPWLVPGRTTFSYYMLPAVPFMAAGVALAIGRLARAAAGASRPVAAAAGGGLGAGAVAAAWSYYPVWTAMPVGFAHFAVLRHLPGVH